MLSNDNDRDSGELMPCVPDAHGQAALILIESLLHSLLENSVLTIGQAVEVVESAIDVQAGVAEAADGALETMWRSHSLLSSISASLRIDLDALARPNLELVSPLLDPD